MTPLSLIGTVFAGLLQTVGIRAGTEQPDYQVIARVAPVERGAAVEIRRYGPRLTAEVIVRGDEMQARNEGFRKVAAYIFGDNAGRQSVAMTAPVVQDRVKGQSIAMTAPVLQDRMEAGAIRIRFVMPAKYDLSTLPAPTDPDVRLSEAKPQTFAVLRFSGSRSPEAMDRALGRLKAAVAASDWRVTGEPEEWFYDPPWTAPFLRRNEVALPVVLPLTGR